MRVGTGQENKLPAYGGAGLARSSARAELAAVSTGKLSALFQQALSARVFGAVGVPSHQKVLLPTCN